jgi:hypothetical protein
MLKREFLVLMSVSHVGRERKTERQVDRRKRKDRKQGRREARMEEFKRNDRKGKERNQSQALVVGDY